MSRTLKRDFFQKIFLGILASVWLIFPVLSRPDLAIAQDINIIIEQIERSLRQDPNNPEAHLSWAIAYFQKFKQTNQIRYLDLAIQKAEDAVIWQSKFAPAQLIFYALLGEKAIDQRDVTLFERINQQYQVVLQSSLSAEQLKKLAHPFFIAAKVYWNMRIDKAGTEEQARYE